MSDFAPAVAIVLVHEAGYVNDPNDPGGETNRGISKRSYPDEDIKNMTDARASFLYQRDFWDPYHMGDLTEQRVANKVLDMAVNIGPIPAIRILQMAIAHFVAGPLVCDGKIGPQTVTLAASVGDDLDKLMNEIKARIAVYHASIHRPEDMLGWMRRDVEG